MELPRYQVAHSTTSHRISGSQEHFLVLRCNGDCVDTVALDDGK